MYFIHHNNKNKLSQHYSKNKEITIPISKNETRILTSQKNLFLKVKLSKN
jgi:hypothetical protein